MNECRCRCRKPGKEEWEKELQVAGCTEKTIAQIQELVDCECDQGILRILNRQKQERLSELHQKQSQIDQLDLLMYSISGCSNK